MIYYKIVDIKRGEGKYRSKILYAKLVDLEGNIKASATLDFILKNEYSNSHQIINYKEALYTFIDFYNTIIEQP